SKGCSVKARGILFTRRIKRSNLWGISIRLFQQRHNVIVIQGLSLNFSLILAYSVNNSLKEDLSNLSFGYYFKGFHSFIINYLIALFIHTRLLIRRYALFVATSLTLFSKWDQLAHSRYIIAK